MPFVSCFVAWNLISHYNKARKASSTWDHLNNKAKVQTLFDFMIAALPGSQQPHAEVYSSQESFTQGNSCPHESFRESFTISLEFDHQQKSQS